MYNFRVRDQIVFCAFRTAYCLEGREDLGEFVTPTAFSKVKTLILSDVVIPPWFLPSSMHPWDDRQRPGFVHTFILRFRWTQPRDGIVAGILMRLAEDRGMKGSPFKVLHFIYMDTG